MHIMFVRCACKRTCVYTLAQTSLTWLNATHLFLNLNWMNELVTKQSNEFIRIHIEISNSQRKKNGTKMEYLVWNCARIEFVCWELTVDRRGHRMIRVEKSSSLLLCCCCYYYYFFCENKLIRFILNSVYFLPLNNN